MINPWNWFVRAGQIGFINIDMGSSANPNVEQKILDDVGSYGRQLGRIGDALGVLLDHVDESAFSEREKDIVADLRLQLAGVDRVKRKYAAPAGS